MSNHHRPDTQLMRRNYQYRKLAIQHQEIDEMIDQMEEQPHHTGHPMHNEVRRLKVLRLRLADQLKALEEARFGIRERRQMH